MIRSFRGIVVRILAILTCTSLNVLSPILAAGAIIVPDFSELSPFSPEWCAPNSLGGKIKDICYGHLRFRPAKLVRALEFTDSHGRKYVYVDSDFRGVELTRLDIQITGPVFSSDAAGQGSQIETGQVSLRIDNKGEVAALRATTVRFGKAIAFSRSK